METRWAEGKWLQKVNSQTADISFLLMADVQVITSLVFLMCIDVHTA